MKRTISAILLILITFSCKQIPVTPAELNIILLIGDGMGIAQIYAAMTANNGNLNLEKCTHTGLQKTYSANRYITDSGAAATAMATGIKTKNGMIGTDIYSQPVRTILEYAEINGLSTGLVATSTITHATPASFLAHQPDRGEYEKIAADFLDSGIDIFIGGGKNHFTRREDRVNLLDSLVIRGYHITNNVSEINIQEEKIACFTADLDNSPADSGRGDMLPEATKNAIHFLHHKGTGFFLMVEGSQIDWAAHDNDTKRVISEMIDFDKAIGVALDFAEKNKNTLVIITADHETGGMGITGGDVVSSTVEAYFVTDGHTATMVPVFACGPGSEKFSGIYENTAIFHKMMESYGFRIE
ncbi:MAG: alkaline phosphatase [Bacteroides sp. SM23_62_1]|nr:MAG: alkaline phosphatase [Bacteroides sp. SM23_62_1]